MNHIKKAEIVFPEVSDRKVHVKRRVTVETGQKVQPQTEWQTFCEGFTFTVVFTILAIIFFAAIAACEVKP